ncbi:MAG: serine hydrolase [Patescibacteria group bacterium]|nr:serine hydrolase [Patescibacteria group bacterium]
MNKNHGISEKISMNIQWQTLLLVILILVSVTITRIGDESVRPSEALVSSEENSAVNSLTPSPELDFQRTSILRTSFEVEKAPARDWEVLDPRVGAESVLIQSLDDNYPFFHLNTYKTWPMASLTKLLTALVVLEDVGANKKILITEEVVATEGKAGELRSGEVYTARDLLRIMLLTSSNDAAAAFENYLGKDEFVRLLNQKARKLGMTQTILHDASGLSDINFSTASDLLRLAKYILENEPDIFNWSRLPSQLVQPINDVTSRTILNINALVNEQNFLGGKTGTSDVAGENLLAILSLGNKRLIAILLGSPDRNKEIKSLFNWIEEAYDNI